MRVRLLIDTLITDEEVPLLAEEISDQPVLQFQLPGLGLTGGRLVGAQPVHADDH